MKQNKQIQSFLEELDRYIYALDEVLSFIDTSEFDDPVSIGTLKALRCQYLTTRNSISGQEV